MVKVGSILWLPNMTKIFDKLPRLREVVCFDSKQSSLPSIIVISRDTNSNAQNAQSFIRQLASQLCRFLMAAGLVD